MLFSTVDSRSISVALFAGGKWLNWSQSASVPTWETIFVPANHLLACTANSTFASLQQAKVPDNAMVQADCLIAFAGGQPLDAMSIPPNAYFGPYPTPGALR